MSTILDRLPLLLDEQLQDMPTVLQNATDPKRDATGSASNVAAGLLRFVGVAKFVLNHDIVAFRRHLLESAQTRLRLIHRSQNGESISPSYLTMLNYKAILNALAACGQDVAIGIARGIGNLKAIENQHDHPFDLAFGYALRAFVLDDPKEMQRRSMAFSEICNTKANLDFRGYARSFHGLLEKDGGLVQDSLGEIVRGHVKQSKGKGVFVGTEDEVLCAWGIGIANLARMKGMQVSGVSPMIPSELLCT